MESIKDESARGNCYESAFKLMCRHEPDKTVLCHGIVTQSKPPHVRMGHAWLEVRLSDGKTIVRDPLFPEGIVEKDQYYRIGKVEYVVRYTLVAACDNVGNSRMYGPWDEKIGAVAHANENVVYYTEAEVTAAGPDREGWGLKTAGWYYLDESGTHVYGPYDSAEEAKVGEQEYVRALNRDPVGDC